MSKILLVEDDNNLREIYEARLQAEGYEIVSARDGEEALTVAMKERPDLIISDVMMPKISGFDMLDIIRSTEETKDVKVIMMTALSQAEDKARAEKLGADRYLVKSQVTLEDVAKVAREVLSGESHSSTPISTPTSVPVSPTSNDTSIPAPAPTSEPAVSTTQPPVPVTSQEPTATPQPITDSSQVQNDLAQTNVPAPTPVATPQPDPIQNTDPVNPALEAINTAGSPQDPASSPSNTSESEQEAIASQIESFIESKNTGTEETLKQEVQITESPVNTDQTANQSVNEDQIVENTTETHATEANQIPTDTDASSPSGKKVIQPLSDPTASKGPDLESLLQKEAEREEMAAIAKGLASTSNQPQQTVPVEQVTETADLKITEDGDLVIKTPPTTTSETQTPQTTTGTNIDGVVQPSPTTPSPKPANSVDPDSIAL